MLCFLICLFLDSVITNRTLPIQLIESAKKIFPVYIRYMNYEFALEFIAYFIYIVLRLHSGE